MSKKIRTEAVDYLFDAILSLKDKEECYTFFEDICTINELLSLSQRFEEDAEGKEDLSGNRGEDRRVYGDHQPGKPFPELWKRRI